MLFYSTEYIKNEVISTGTNSDWCVSCVTNDRGNADAYVVDQTDWGNGVTPSSTETLALGVNTIYEPGESSTSTRSTSGTRRSPALR
jgi:hypothetical protein